MMLLYDDYRIEVASCCKDIRKDVLFLKNEAIRISGKGSLCCLAQFEDELLLMRQHDPKEMVFKSKYHFQGMHSCPTITNSRIEQINKFVIIQIYENGGLQ